MSHESSLSLRWTGWLRVLQVLHLPPSLQCSRWWRPVLERYWPPSSVRKEKQPPKNTTTEKTPLSLTEQIKRGIFISSVCSPFSITVSVCVSSAVAPVCLCRCNLECVAIVMSLCVLLSLSNAFRCGEDQTAVPTGSGLQRYNSVLTWKLTCVCERSWLSACMRVILQQFNVHVLLKEMKCPWAVEWEVRTEGTTQIFP